MPNVADVMTREAHTVSPETTVAEAAQAMVRGRFGSVLVCEGSWLVGIFTERDALRCTAEGIDPSSTPVSEWMTKDPVTATPDVSTDDALQRMVGGGFRHLPVVEGEGAGVVGVVSFRDLLAPKIGG